MEMPWKSWTAEQKWWAAAGTVAVIAIGVIAFRRTRKARLVMGHAPEAPAVDGFSDGNMTTTLHRSDDMPIEERVATIQRLVYKSTMDPAMRKIALEVTRHCAERDGECEARAVYKFVKDNVRYTGDIAPIAQPDGSVDGIDLYQAAKRTLEMGGGDCDDQSILSATLLSLNGINARLRVMKERKKDDWSHIFVVAGLPKENPTSWHAIDTTLPGDDHFGEEVPFADALDFPA